ncbi:MAG: hypothetical protein J6B81_04050 [Spirochaetaceae bacterium]|nr:hypothetical protein [Spirochaetaceae bacterium]
MDETVLSNEVVSENDSFVEQENTDDNTSEVQVLENKVETEKPLVLPKKKKKPFFLRFLSGIFLFILIIIFLLVAWFAFATFEKKDPISVIPTGYSLYLHTDDLWDAVNPIIDLQAADILLSGSETQAIRSLLMEIRSSSLRSNKFLDIVLSRQVDATLYGTGELFFVAVDLSFISGITRLAPLLAPLLNIENLTYYETSDCNSVENFFEFKIDDNYYFIKPYHNMILATNSFEILKQSLSSDYRELYTDEQLALIEEKSSHAIKILVDGLSLVESMGMDKTVSEPLQSLLKKDSFGLLSFDISDAEIKINSQLPIDTSSNEAVAKITKGKQAVPAIISRLGNRVQYYTVLNAGSLQELKDALLPMLPPEKNVQKLWEDGNKLCKTLFKLSLEDLLFSWTGKEFTAFGIEGLNNPVFALQVSDEVARAKVFQQVFDSLLVSNDSSLIVDGVRLPRIKLPDFLNAMLEVFGISIPYPYYMLQDGYIYFSSSPECLSVVYSSAREGLRLVSMENWKQLSSVGNHKTTIELFYDLERTVPFFLRGNNVFSQVLQLYSVGLCNILFEDGTLNFSLHSVARESGSLRMLPGFPIQMENNVQPVLYKQPGKNPKYLFWQEKDSVLSSIELSSMEIRRLDFSEKCWLVAAQEKDDGSIWVCTQEGTVYLLDGKLQSLEKFPVFTGKRVSGEPVACSQGIIFPVETGGLCLVSYSGAFETISLPTTAGKIVAPVALGEYVALYEKAFLGRIHIFKNSENITQPEPLSVSGIGFGSPALLLKDDVLYVAFITQAGMLSVWANGFLVEEISQKLDGVFYQNVVATENSFYALSADATVYKIGLDGEVVKVKIPDSSTRNGYLRVIRPQDNGPGNVYVSVDGNLIYGFTESLELLSGFPLVGWGIPTFADANADKIADCFVFTLDNKLSAWNLR